MAKKAAAGLSGASIDQILGINGSSTSGNTTSGPPTPNATAVASNDPTAWYYTPEYMVASPQETPGAFGMSGTDVTPGQATPNTNIFTGDAGTSPPLTDNALMAKIADKLGIKVGKNFDTELAKKLPATMRQDLPNGAGEAPSVSLTQVAQHLGISMSGPPNNPQYATAAQIATQLAHGLSSTDLSTLQQQMYNAGFYDNAIYTDKSVVETPGHTTQWTTGAIGNMLSALNQYNQSNPDSPMTWEQFLQASQTNPNMQGPIGAAKNTLSSIPLATSTQLTPTLQSVFEKELGHLPSAQDIQSFTQWYQTQQKAAKGVTTNPDGTLSASPSGTLGAGAAENAAQQAQGSGIVDYTTGIPELPQVPTAAEAAIPYAQSQDPTGYLAHQVSNSYAMALSLIFGDSSLRRVPGYDPNVISASSAL
jgi:hypothetical protein